MPAPAWRLAAGQVIRIWPGGGGPEGVAPAALSGGEGGITGWVRQAAPPLVTVEWVDAAASAVTGLAKEGAAVVITCQDGRGVQMLAGRVESVRREPSEVAASDGAPGRLVAVVRVQRAERLQRRAFFRWPARWTVAYAVHRGGEAERPAMVWVRAQTREVSGGGLSMIAPEELAPGDRLSLKLALPGGDLICAEGRVVRAARAGPDPGTQGGRWVVAVEFTDILKEARERIEREILAAQLRLRRQGLM